MSYHSSSVAESYRKRGYPAFPTGRSLYITTPVGRKVFSSSSKSPANESITTQPMKSHYTLNSQFTPVEFLFIRTPSNSPLSSIKESNSPLFYELTYGFCYDLLVPNGNSSAILK